MNEDYYLQLKIYTDHACNIKVRGFYTFNMAISQDYGVVIKIESCQPEENHHFLGKPATLLIHPQDTSLHQRSHFLSGIITCVEPTRLIIRSPLHPLKSQKQSRTYQYVDLHELAEVILKKYRLLKGHDYEVIIDNSPEVSPLINKRFLQQQDQSDYDFFTDTLARLGGFFIFEQIENFARLKIYADPKQLIQQQSIRLPLMPWQGGERRYGTAYSFAEHAFLLPARVLSLDYHTPTARALSVDSLAVGDALSRRRARHGTLKGDGKQVFYTDNYQAQTQGEQIVRFHHEALNWQRQLITIYTDDLSLLPGAMLELTMPRAAKQFRGSQFYQVLAVDITTARTKEVQAKQNEYVSCWIPTMVKQNPHSLFAFYEQLKNQSQKLPASGLQARVWLIPLSTPYRTPIVDYQAQGASFQRAVITARAENELLGQNAYYVRYDYETLSEIEALPSSLPVRLRQPFTAPAEAGAHFALLPGTPVLIGHLYNNLEQPVILGVLPTETHAGPVCDANYRQHKITSQAGHQFLLQDDPQHPCLALGTADAAQQLLLDATPDQHKVSLIQKTGNIELVTGQALHEQTQGDYLLSATENYHMTVNGEHQLRASQFLWSARESLQHNAKHKVRFIVEQGALQVAAAHDLLIDAADNLTAHIETDDFSLKIAKGSLILHAAQTIDLSVGAGEGVEGGEAGVGRAGAGVGKVGTGVGEASAGEIKIKQGAACLKLNAKGELLIEAPNVVFKADKVALAGVTDFEAVMR